MEYFSNSRETVNKYYNFIHKKISQLHLGQPHHATYPQTQGA